MKNINWKLERRAVKSLIPANYNPRKLSDKAKEDLKKSIMRFGKVEPIVVNTDNVIVGGHQRIGIYVDLGEEFVDVMVPNRKLSAQEEKELNLRLNKNVGEWDWGKIEEFFGIDELVEAGFSEQDISAEFDKLAEAREDDFDFEKEAGAIESPISKTGDMWLLGGASASLWRFHE